MFYGLLKKKIEEKKDKYVYVNRKYWFEGMFIVLERLLMKWLLCVVFILNDFLYFSFECFVIYFKFRQ